MNVGRERTWSMLCSNCGSKLKKSKKDYRYIESGLNNVILKNIDVHECSECGQSLAGIRNVEGIHKAIALALVKKASPLDGSEVRFLRKEMELNAKKFAALLGVDPVSVSRWENLKTEVGITNDKLIRMLFIQHMEEECNQVARDTLELIGSIRKTTAKKQLINIPYSKSIAVCLMMGKG